MTRAFHGACPERSRGETLVESIDRVAAGLTAVPPDPGFAARLDVHLDAPSPRLMVWVGFAGLKSRATATAAVVLVFVAVIGRGVLRETTAPVSRNPGTVATAQRAHVPMTDEATVSTPRVETSRDARPTRRPQPEVIEPFVAAIAALTTPQTLRVDELRFESLTIAPVELGHLDLASLEVREIDPLGQPKE